MLKNCVCISLAHPVACELTSYGHIKKIYTLYNPILDVREDEEEEGLCSYQLGAC